VGIIGGKSRSDSESNSPRSVQWRQLQIEDREKIW